MVNVRSSVRFPETSLWVCRSCARRQRILLAQGQRRPVHLSYLKKQAAAEEAWEAQAEEIKDGKKESMLQILESRGYIGQIAGFVVDFRCY